MVLPPFRYMMPECGRLTRKRSEPDHVDSAVRFIADQFGGPGRVLAVHRTTASGLCAACSSIRPVRWPCSIAAMALQAELQQKR
jgi:hypothetical protein